MEIQFLGHSCFRIKGKKAILVTDPYDYPQMGFKMPRVSADIVTVSHQHQDHNNVSAITGTTRKKEPFVISGPGEYEILGVFVFGVSSFHDEEKGAKRGQNTIYVINIDGMRLVHLGDLGHTLDDKQLEEVNGADILFIPVGGTYTIDPKVAIEVIGQIQPKIIIPMHYKTTDLNPDFGIEITVDDFLKEIGVEAKPIKKLTISRDKLPEEREVVVLKKK